MSYTKVLKEINCAEVQIIGWYGLPRSNIWILVEQQQQQKEAFVERTQSDRSEEGRNTHMSPDHLIYLTISVL